MGKIAITYNLRDEIKNIFFSAVVPFKYYLRIITQFVLVHVSFSHFISHHSFDNKLNERIQMFSSSSSNSSFSSASSSSPSGDLTKVVH